MKKIISIVVLGALAVPGAAIANDAKSRAAWLKADQTHRAIFCGEAGHEEASRAYSTAMAKALNEEKAAGRSAAEAIGAWQAEFCGETRNQRAAAVAAPAPSTKFEEVKK